METAEWKGRALRKRVAELLDAEDFDAGLRKLLDLPARKIINPLISALYAGDEQTHWRAVASIGAVVARWDRGHSIRRPRKVR